MHGDTWPWAILEEKKERLFQLENVRASITCSLIGIWDRIPSLTMVCGQPRHRQLPYVPVSKIVITTKKLIRMKTVNFITPGTREH